MNIEHLKLFIRIANTQNISMAGQSMGLSAAVASNHINKLETNLGVRLIHRTTRKISLTEEGKSFLPYAEDVVASVTLAKESLTNSSSSMQGRLRISAPASFGRMHLLPALSLFIKSHPELTIDLRLSDSIVDLVEGGFDIAIRNSALKDSSLIARKLIADQRIICASPEYIKNHGQPKTPQDLSDHQCLVLNGMDHWQFSGPDGITNIKAVGNLTTDNGEVIRDACVAGLGITICSKWIAYQQLQKKQLLQILEDYPLAIASDIWAVYPSARQLAPKVRVFIEFIKGYFGDTPYWEQ